MKKIKTFEELYEAVKELYPDSKYKHDILYHRNSEDWHVRIIIIKNNSNSIIEIKKLNDNRIQIFKAYKYKNCKKTPPIEVVSDYVGLATNINPQKIYNIIKAIKLSEES